MSYIPNSDEFTQRVLQESITKDSDAPDTGFAALKLEKKMLTWLNQSDFHTPTEIQTKAIPSLLAGRDLLAQAKTGSGKTLAFALPIIQNIKTDKAVDALILTPTRELAQQVADVFRKLAKIKKLGVTCVVGQESYSQQIEGISRGSQIVIATPGRLLDLLSSKKLKNFRPRTVVFDEADEMLNMGFIEDIKSILRLLPEERQTVFFSATFPDQIVRLAKTHQKNPSFIRLDSQKEQASTSIEQCFYLIKDYEKKDALLRLLYYEQPVKAIVFCRTKGETENLQGLLVSKDIKSKVLHGDLSQPERNRTIREFRSGVYHILVATDIASRGLDIDDVSHVFNYDLPENHDRYTHRIGRTGRADKKGKSCTFTTKAEWEGHFFLRQVKLKDVRFSELPNKGKVEEAMKGRLLEQIKSVSVSGETTTACREILGNDDSFALFCQLYAFVTKDHRVLGPNSIGFSQERIKRFVVDLKKSKLSYRSRRSFSGRSTGRFSSRRSRNFQRAR